MMKKVLSLMLAFALVCSLSVLAFAEGEQTGTTTITAEVPEASYTIHIPADATLTYGDTSVKTLGDVYVSDLVNVNGTIHVNSYATVLKNGSNYITITYTVVFPSGVSYPVPFSGESSQFASWNFSDVDSATIQASVEDWSGAVPGTYTSTITWSFWIELD